MPNVLIYPIGTTDACRYAAAHLQTAGVPIIDHPSPEITHLLLDIPCKCDLPQLTYTLSMLPDDVTVIGGNLKLPQNKVWDFLQDENYLCCNAAITAHCALKVIMSQLKSTLPETRTLILGWGRIGKCLSKLLYSIDCPVTVAARNPKDRAMLSALGYRTHDITDQNLIDFDLLINTVPDMILPEDPCSRILTFDLASNSRISGSHVIAARGLPGTCAPISSGNLIVRTILSYLKEEKS